jgi:hypothetical protein
MASLIFNTNQKFKLSHHVWQRRFFDPNNKEDVKEYAHFLKHSQWKTNCPFILEWPYLTITDMVKDKLVEHWLSDEVKKA